MAAKLFPTIKDLAQSGYVFRIQDAGPETLDRITVTFCDGEYLALSKNGLGFSQWGGTIDPVVMHEHAESGQAVDLALGDLSPELQNHILHRVNEAFEDALESGERMDPKIVAKSRNDAKENQGIHDSWGVGIYSEKDGEFFVRKDGSAGQDEDFGPYSTVREAFVATLPDDYSLSGPEYHPKIKVSSLNATPGVAEKIAALEAGKAA